MGVEMCSRCDKYVDLDWDCDDMYYIGKDMKPVCFDCLDEAESNRVDPGAFPDVEPCDYEVVQ